MESVPDLEIAREWLADNCHHAHVRSLLERSLSLAHALERAGWPLHTVDGDDLYNLVTDSRVNEFVHHHLVQSTL